MAYETNIYFVILT